jgi:hypothetical protein
MRRLLALALACGLFLSLGTVSASSAPIPMKKFKNCSELWKAYPNGVARSRQASLSASQMGYKRPTVKARIYRLNRNLEFEVEPGVACAVLRAASMSPGDMFDKALCDRIAYENTREQMPAYCARFGY